VRPIVQYLLGILALLARAAARLRPHRDRAWRRAAALAADLRARRGRATRVAWTAASRLGARLAASLGRCGGAAAAGMARLGARLARSWRAAQRQSASRRSSRRRPRPAAARRQRRVRAVAPPAPVLRARLDPDRQWEIVVGVAAREAARASAVAALQARAALKIDAAEHALGRILADCARVVPAAEPPAVQLATQPDAQTSRPLAA
jgi:hypothetical protein